jgi:hypothetical protein
VFDHFDLIAPFYDRAIPFSRLEHMLRFVSLPAGDRLDGFAGLSYPGPR